MKFLICQKFNFNYMFFLLYLVSCLVTKYIEVYSGDDETQENDEKKIDNSSKLKGHFHEYLSVFVVNFSDFLAIIPYYIKKYLSKKADEYRPTPKLEEASGKLNTYYIYNNLYEDELGKRSTSLNLYSFLVGLLDFLAEIVFFLYCLENKPEFEGFIALLNSTVIFQILFQYILSIIILKSRFYRHHYLSIIINSICFIILFVFDLINIKKSIYWGYIFMYVITLVFLVLENAYGKKAMVFGYVSPYTLLIFKGAYKLILLVVFSAIFIPIMFSIEGDFFSDITDFDSMQIFMIFLNFVFSFFKNLFNWILIDRFSPSHLALSLILEDLSYLVITLIFEDDVVDVKGDNNNSLPAYDSVTRIIIYFVLFIAALIHNEIFIITKCGLGNNTKLFLDEKVKEELLLSNLEADTEFLKRFDTMIEMENNSFVENEDDEDVNDVNNNNINENNKNS